MEFKQIYDKSSGNETLISSNEDGLFEYDSFIYTDVKPSNDLYDPKYFDGDKWIGSTKEEWEAQQEKPTIEPKALELMVSQLQLQVTIGNKKTKDLEDKLEVTNKSLADSLLKITEIENKLGGNA